MGPRYAFDARLRFNTLARLTKRRKAGLSLLGDHTPTQGRTASTPFIGLNVTPWNGLETADSLVNVRPNPIATRWMRLSLQTANRFTFG
jgi:hypothetical protein